MTNDERLSKAREWLAAAKARRAYTEDEIDAHHDDSDDHPDAWWSSRYNLLDGMQDRINTIYALFPELREEDEN